MRRYSEVIIISNASDLTRLLRIWATASRVSLPFTIRVGFTREHGAAGYSRVDLRSRAFGLTRRAMGATNGTPVRATVTRSGTITSLSAHRTRARARARTRVAAIAATARPIAVRPARVAIGALLFSAVLAATVLVITPPAVTGWFVITTAITTTVSSVRGLLLPL